MPEKLPYVRTLIYALRIVAGIFIIALLLYAASRTTRDCTVGLYVFDICSWVWLREQLGLPASKSPPRASRPADGSSSTART